MGLVSCGAALTSVGFFGPQFKHQLGLFRHVDLNRFAFKMKKVGFEDVAAVQMDRYKGDFTLLSGSKPSHVDTSAAPLVDEER